MPPEARLRRIVNSAHEFYVRRQSLTPSQSPWIGRASAQNGPHCEIGFRIAEHGKRQEQMPLRQHVGSGETMHRDGIRFEDARDLAKDRCMVADVFHHLVTEAKLKMTVGER